MRNPKISIIIVTYNSEKVIMQCINSILTQKYDNYEVIIIDGGSKDRTVELVKKIKGVRLINIKKNMGFSKLNNIGVKSAKGEYLLFLNPDTEITDKEMLSVLISEIRKNPRIGAISPIQFRYENSKKIYNPVFTILPAGHVIHLDFADSFRFFSKRYSNEKEPTESLKYVDFPPGSCVLIKKDLFKKIGEFDEDFFMYYEDTSLGLSVWKNGYCCAVTKNTESFHAGGAGSRVDNLFLRYHYWRGRVIFVKKWDTISFPLILAILIMSILRALIFHRNLKEAKAIVNGFLAGINSKKSN